MFRGRDHDQLKEFTLLTNIRTPENYVSFVRMLLFNSVEPRFNGPTTNGILLIIDANLWSLQVNFFNFLNWL